MPIFEGEIIRPPSEADSLILQYTIGCSHNKCIFCPAYKQKKFRIRSIEEMERQVKDCLPELENAKRIFLADGDALAAPQDDLLALCKLLSAGFSRLKRIGMYANAASILRKSPEELERLQEHGLGILYLGIESGDDRLLAWMRKGVAANEIREAGRRVKKAGIKLSVTVLLGIGGRAGSEAHAEATGNLLSDIDPDYVGALTTMVVPGTPLYCMEQAGDFILPESFEILHELGVMLKHTEMRGIFFANHASNYLPLQVRMPMQRDAAVKMIGEFVRERDASLLKPEWLRGL